MLITEKDKIKLEKDILPRVKIIINNSSNKVLVNKLVDNIIKVCAIDNKDLENKIEILVSGIKSITEDKEKIKRSEELNFLVENEIKKREYFYNRATEIIKSDPKTQRDLWIAQWELENLILIFIDLNIDFRDPESHSLGFGSGPNIRHINLVGTHKHIFITPDPFDRRIQKSSVDFRSRVYDFSKRIIYQ